MNRSFARRQRHVPPLPPASILLLIIPALLLAGCGGTPPPECELFEGSWDGWTIEVVLLDGTIQNRTVYPSPEGLDADGDGLDDCVEFLMGTDPNDADTAENRLLDGQNVVLAADHPRAQEWDARGIAYLERDDGRWEFQGAGAWGVDPTMQDTAGSGILDGQEVAGFTVWILGEPRIVRTNPRLADTSGDGLTDGYKWRVGLDPTLRDTAGDGVEDSNDVNPWIAFQVRLEVVSLNLTNDPHGRSERPLTMTLQVPQAEFRSPPVVVRVGETTSGAPFSSPPVSPTNRGGDILLERHDVGLSLTVASMEGEMFIPIDLVSHTTGSTTVFGGIHALTGDLFWSPGGPGPATESWPETGTFHGDHGDITFRVLPVWPAPWQLCIDEGCRHGAGEFPWR